MGDALEESIINIPVKSTPCSDWASHLPIKVCCVGQGWFRGLTAESHGVRGDCRRSRYDLVVTGTDISVFLEHFSHDSVITLNAVITSSSRGGVGWAGTGLLCGAQQHTGVCHSGFAPMAAPVMGILTPACLSWSTHIPVSARGKGLLSPCCCT